MNIPLFNLNKDTEKEVSSGVLIGYVLVGFAAVLIVAFIIFMVVKKVSNNSDAPVETQVTTEQSIEVEEEK